MLPQPLIEEYWNRVCKILHEEYHLHRSQSEQAVCRYRTMVEPNVGEMTYHQDAREVAETISHTVKR